MGALGFLGGFSSAASKAAAEGSQNDLQKLQIVEQLRDDQLRRAVLQNQLATANKQLLKMPDGSYQLVDLANPKQPGVKIGQSGNYVQDLQTLRSAAPKQLQPLVDSAIASNDPLFQQEILKSLPGEIAKAQTKGSTQFQQELGLFRSDPATFMAMKGAGRQPKSLHLVTTTDPDGHTIQVWYDPTTGTPAAGLSPIRGKLSNQEIASLEATRSLTADIPKLQAAADKIVKGSPYKMAYEYSKYKYPTFGLRGVTDPDYEDYFSQIGNVKSDLARLQSSGSSRSVALLKFIQDHLPKETDPPSAAMLKLHTLEKGRFDSLTKAILGDDASGTPDTSGMSPGAGVPEVSKMKAVVGTPILGPDGRIIGFKR